MSSSLTTGSSYGQLMIVLLIFVGVLALTYFVTRWISGYQRARGEGANIQLVESLPLAANKYVQIIRIGQKYYALAITKDNVTLIAELGKDDINIATESVSTMSSFRDILSHAKKINEDEENE